MNQRYGIPKAKAGGEFYANGKKSLPFTLQFTPTEVRVDFCDSNKKPSCADLLPDEVEWVLNGNQIVFSWSTSTERKVRWEAM